MKFWKKMKDGGNQSTVTGYWLIEAKKLFSIVLLKFEGKSREAYHSHAFNSVSWVLKGELVEDRIDNSRTRFITHYLPSVFPIVTTRKNMHQVNSVGTTWVLSFRGPWSDIWHEQLSDGRHIRLTHGRKEVFSSFSTKRVLMDCFRCKKSGVPATCANPAPFCSNCLEA